jgi:hypothetical protein
MHVLPDRWGDDAKLSPGDRRRVNRGDPHPVVMCRERSGLKHQTGTRVVGSDHLGITPVLVGEE